MAEKIFREGGPLNVRRTGPDQYTMNVSIPPDSDGRTARECPDADCSPGYFKVKPGTGITEGQKSAFCPYCRQAAEPGAFVTKEQLRFARDIVKREAHEGIERVLKDSLGLGSSGRRKFGGGFLSIEMQYKPGSKPIVRRPVEEPLRRDVICPGCELDQSVFGLATWCADCGLDIFLTHVEAELTVVQSMLSDISRRRDALGVRVAAKDLENALEDTVSIFEAVLRIIARRGMLSRGMGTEEVDRCMKQLGSGLQNVDRANQFLWSQLGVQDFAGMAPAELDQLGRIFEKRHPITHNLGVVDRKYLERARSAEEEGKEVMVSEAEIASAVTISSRAFRALYASLFPGGMEHATGHGEAPDR